MLRRCSTVLKVSSLRPGTTPTRTGRRKNSRSVTSRHGDGISRAPGHRRATMTTTRLARPDTSGISVKAPDLPARVTTASTMEPGRSCPSTATSRRPLDSAQFNWVAQELRNSTAKCTLVYWHHPVFSSGYEGNMQNMRSIWQLLYDHNAEVVLVGHSHNYERFAPQDVNGQPEPGRGSPGVRGRNRRQRSSRGLESMKANSEVFNNQFGGSTEADARADRYSWEFIPLPALRSATPATTSASSSDESSVS